MAMLNNQMENHIDMLCSPKLVPYPITINNISLKRSKVEWDIRFSASKLSTNGQFLAQYWFTRRK